MKYLQFTAFATNHRHAGTTKILNLLKVYGVFSILIKLKALRICRSIEKPFMPGKSSNFLC